MARRRGGDSPAARDLLDRARKLHEEDAFAPAETGVGNAVDINAVAVALSVDRKRNRKFVLVFASLMVVLAIASLPLNYYTTQPLVYPLSEVWDCYVLFFKCNILPLFDPVAAGHAGLWQAEFQGAYGGGDYANIMLRLALTGLTVLCGFLLAVSGMLFQTAFRNPLAAPSMLGVSDGVSLGYVVFILLGFSNISESTVLFTVLVYVCGAATLVFVLLASRFFSGGKAYNVFDMLLVGTVIAQLVGGIVTYITNFGMDIETWYRFYELQQSLDAPTYVSTYVACGIAAVIASVPVIVLRFRMNLISFSNEEGRMLGACPGLLRGVALVCGALMQLAALASIGQVAMVGLAVPFLCRYLFASDFRNQLVGNFVVGSTVLLACQIISHFVIIDGIAMPVGTVVGLVILPFFVWMMALQRKGWGDE